ncbi:hypothetical protein SAMN06265375_103236 [Muriicola jejuensis]|uniref:Uncharacterized protein n=1 Tax=Muriicola jejuensis TaxID=504488 RepID=A0A6P0UMB9_9FLAO|nr:hypothetical protein [Muriicola jejuensis]NER11406.1 hypothetical protein [Muriicola jejuensis]SMP20915.1 hypothetical protein SAMN06265375_103236 [Muriicola jejuensis]
MNNQTLLFILYILFLYPACLISQAAEDTVEVKETSRLFLEQETLPIRLAFSNKEMKKETNDSTYLFTKLHFKDEGNWDSLDVRIRARGNYRRTHCYFPPLKVKIKKSEAKGTLFKGNKELKLVMPCVQSTNTLDNIVKEYMAYKIYEVISPFHFKTRMADIEFIEFKGNKNKVHQVKGFIIEDIDNVAERTRARKMNRVVHPLEQDDITSVQNDLFQYMIGNTDFSTAYQHNQKLLFTEDYKTVPLPYDFDMSGLVDASYAVVSQVGGEVLSIESVTDRMYRGFVRDEAVFQTVRRQYLDLKPEIFGVIDGLKSEFDNEKEFEIARKFIGDFYTVLENDNQFASQIVRMARTK